MEKYTLIILSAFIYLFSTSIFAVDVQLCKVDGEAVYMKTCPPGSELIKQQKIFTKKEPAPKQPTVVLYFQPNCKWCPEIRDYFAQYAIPITEKDLTDNQVLQQELLESSNELIIPTVKMNESFYKGYFPNKMDKQLQSLGYPIEDLSEILPN